MSTPVLSVENLDYGFRGKTVGRGFTFALHENEVMAVLGPNGAGKTTLFRTLLGLLPPHAGAIRLLGKRLSEYSQAELARTLTYVPQAHDSYFPFAARDVVLMGRTAHLRIFASPGAKDREIADAALKQLRIEPLADRPFDELSGGEQQLVLIARALATEAKVFILDEPTANLDYGNQLMVLAEIARLKQMGKSVLFCTHHPEHARETDSILTIRNGEVFDHGKTRAVLQKRVRMAQLYGQLPEEHHPAFPQPENPSQSVWRYLSHEKFCRLLSTKQLSLTSLSKMKECDPLEGSFTKAYLEYWRQGGEQNIQILKRDRDNFARTNYVSCWRIADNDSEAMWKLYCEKHEGVAIQTTYRALKASMERQHAMVGLIGYIDYEHDSFDPRNLYGAFMHKRAAFDFECEVRVVRPIQMQVPPYVDESGNFIGLEWDLWPEITAIRVSPFADESYYQSVLDVVRNEAPEQVHKVTWSSHKLFDPE